MKQDVSNEILGAYIDDELACSEKRVIAEEIKSNPEMQARAQTMLDLKTSIKAAYPETILEDRKTSTVSTTKPGKRFYQQSIAASLIMICGLILGAMFNYSAGTSSQTQTVASNDTLFGIKLNPVTPQASKVLLHISSADLNKLDFLLTRTERLLTESQHSNQPFQLEVVANSAGIDLLRKTTTPYADRIQLLQMKYKNLQFIACTNTLRRLQQKGQDVQLLDGIQANKPALDTIINRMDKGWTYVKI